VSRAASAAWSARASSGRAGTSRQSASALPAGVDLDGLWRRIRELLSRVDDQALGTVRVGLADKDEKPWAQTNAGEDRVNLTLELKPEQLELNLVGWKEEQSDALKDWLQSVAGEDAINGLDGYEIVAFARRAYKKTPSSRPWWPDETIYELGRCRASDFNAGWLVRQMVGLKSPKEEKPAFHVRRAWSRQAATALGAGLPTVLAAEVERLLPLLREIWASSSAGRR
jgi:hypothetical protein